MSTHESRLAIIIRPVTAGVRLTRAQYCEAYRAILPALAAGSDSGKGTIDGIGYTWIGPEGPPPDPGVLP